MKVAIVQPAPGIGDMVWFVPHIRAIAKFVGGPVTLVAKPSSFADQMFYCDDAVSEVTQACTAPVVLRYLLAVIIKNHTG